MSALLNLEAFRQAPLKREPFDYVIVPAFVNERYKADLERDFPPMAHAGLFPVQELRFGTSFAALLSELQGPELTSAISEKFGIDLETRPTLATIRGRCRKRDGKIHTDSTWKIISTLLYLNDPWGNEGGRLRLLRSPSLEDVAAELPPDFGMFLAFRRSDRSFHGHRPFEGQRRVIQVNWCTDQKEIDRENARHGKSAWVKRFLSFASRGDY